MLKIPAALLLAFAIVCIAPNAIAQKGSWVNITDDVISQLQKEGKKVGYPGLTAGVTVDPSTGDVYMIVCDQGLWKSTNLGKTFTRVDGGKIGGRCETGFALNFDPAGKRLACFMIYGPCARTEDAGATWLPWKTNHLDFGAVDWEATGKALLAIRHESGGVLCLSIDGGQTWQNLGKVGPDQKIAREDRDYKMFGMFDANSILASRGDSILRSTDTGQTWTKVADAKLTAPVMRLHKGVGYWMSDKGILASKDKGTTWSLAWPVKAVFGPYFGKSDEQIVVVAREGFMKSTDGGATWKNVAPLPPTFNVALIGPNYAWDAVHDVFYASSMGKPTYRFIAGEPATQAAPEVPSLNIWPDHKVPHAQGDEKSDTPAVQIFLPPASKATGSAIVVCPGGGYGGLAGHEATPIAQWLNDNGIAAFVLRYRLGTKYHYPAEIEDGRRAIRFVRAHAADWKIDPHRIGIIGFSAGGHLASSVATHPIAGDSSSEDPVERVSSRPDLHIVIYPVITLTGPGAHIGSRNNLLGKEPDPRLVELFSNQKQVTKETPPAFIVHSITDKVVPVSNADDYAAALKEAGVPYEYIRLETGAHGFGLTDMWTPPCIEWLRRQKF